LTKKGFESSESENFASKDDFFEAVSSGGDSGFSAMVLNLSFEGSFGALDLTGANARFGEEGALGGEISRVEAAILDSSTGSTTSAGRVTLVDDTVSSSGISSIVGCCGMNGDLWFVPFTVGPLRRFGIGSSSISSSTTSTTLGGGANEDEGAADPLPLIGKDVGTVEGRPLPISEPGRVRYKSE
jgi:hypothetical protein